MAVMSTYREELLSRAEDHVREVGRAAEKEGQVRAFGLEMEERVREHEAHIAERKRISERLKGEIAEATLARLV